MRLPSIACCTLLGILPLLILPELPGLTATGILTLLACLLVFQRHPWWQYAGLTLLFFCWGVFAAHQAIWTAQYLPGKNQSVEIVITHTDGQTTHQGSIVRHNGRFMFPTPGITLYGNYLPQAVCAGQRWQMTIRARPVQGQLNDGGFDSQRYALTQQIAITGRFIDAVPIDTRCSLRARYLTSLDAALAGYPWRQVILALGMGERLQLDPAIKATMQQTGISHLMAISGLHIALGASLGWLCIRLIQFLFPCRWISWRFPLIAGFLCALGYAVMTGLQPPAQRTIIAIGIGYALRLQGRQWTPWEVWLCCIAAILFYDPIAVLSQSLWLSAFAVAALIFWYQWMPLPHLRCAKWIAWLPGLLHLQLGIMILLMPMQVVIFHGISMTSLLANLVAVPLVTLVVIPLILAGMMLHLAGLAVVEQGLWWLADRLLGGLFWFLHHLPDGWLGIDERWRWATWLPWLLLVVWRFQAWFTQTAIWLSLTIILTFPLWRHTQSAGWSVTMLDVGQGLAMVIERHGKAILYDTGLAWPGGDSGQQIIIPWLRWHHVQPEGIILSHEHLDHRGGLVSIKKRWPTLWVRSPLGWAGHEACQRGEHWRWQGLNFQALWPLPGMKTQGNNRSCVVRVDDGRYSMLLTGDIELLAERAMLSHYWQHLASTIIQVPHHGSRTSSGDVLLQRVSGEAALASASRYNAWHFPSPKVVQRYQQQGYTWFDTPQQGQITVSFGPDNWQIYSLRNQIFPRWYHQWFGDSGHNG